MGLFEKIFTKKSEPSTTRFEMISDGTSGFYSWDGDVYQSDIVRSCIRPMARAIGKLTAKHIRTNAQEFKVNPDPWIRFFVRRT